MSTIPFLNEAEAIKDELIAYRQHIHENPELGLILPDTQKYVLEKLEEMGIEGKPVDDTSGIMVTLGNKNPGKTYLLRADMDALPIEEETGLAFASKNGNMHACGHDFHIAMLMGAAKILKKYEDQIQGTVKLLFQPGEEILEGAKLMIEKGVLQNPDVDAGMMIHITSGQPFPSGSFGIFNGGYCYASSDCFRIDVTGLGGHGAIPEATISPINILSAINTRIQEIIAMEISAREQCTMTVGEIHCGNAENAISETGWMAGTIRTFNEDVRASIKEKLAASVKAIAESRGGSAELTFFSSTPSVMNDKNVSESIMEGIKTKLKPEIAFSLGNLKVSASEDFAYIAEKIPAALLLFNCGSAKDGYIYGSHNPKSDFDESLIHLGAAVYACSAVHWLETHTI